MSEKTYLPTVKEAADGRKWYVVDAAGQRLGRLTTEIASVLRGKKKPTFTPFMDVGDFVVVINAEKVVVTGRKSTQKLYRRHSGRPGGMKEETFAKLQARIPERIVEKAVKGMLPKNTLGRQLFTKLKVYDGPDHPHAAQNPEVLIINTIPGDN
jgi:large subunit ribosomal protein L13